jgi:hypothetical protein
MTIPYDWSAASRRAAENGRDEWARALATGFLAAGAGRRSHGPPLKLAALRGGRPFCATPFREPREPRQR